MHMAQKTKVNCWKFDNQKGELNAFLFCYCQVLREILLLMLFEWIQVFFSV